MEFFVPVCDSREDAELVWQATRHSAAILLGRSIRERRIFTARFLVRGVETLATIGKPEAITGELIQVILESECFLICTENHGFVRGSPIFTGTPDEVVEFDDPNQRPPLIRLPLPAPTPRRSHGSRTSRALSSGSHHVAPATIDGPPIRKS